MTTPTAMLQYFEPVNRKVARSLVVPPIGTLAGKRIAYVNNGWTCFTKMGVHVERALIDRYGVAEVRSYAIPPSSAPAPGLLEQIAKENDAAIVGLAN